MKKLFALLTIGALALPAFAQFTPGPHMGHALTCPTTGFKLWSLEAATNVTTPSLAPAFSLSGDPNPLCIYMEYAATNATTGVSNITAWFQYSIDGTEWMGPAAVTASHPGLVAAIPGPGGVTPKLFPLFSGPKFNEGVVPPALLGTVTNMTAWRFVRLYSLSNYTAGADSNIFYITNMWFIQR